MEEKILTFEEKLNKLAEDAKKKKNVLEQQEILDAFTGDKLTPEQQDVLMEAGKYASEFNRKISEEAENKVLEELKADGVNVVEVDDITPWQEACKDIIESSTADNKDLYQKIVDMK